MEEAGVKHYQKMWYIEHNDCCISPDDFAPVSKGSSKVGCEMGWTSERKKERQCAILASVWARWMSIIDIPQARWATGGGFHNNRSKHIFSNSRNRSS